MNKEIMIALGQWKEVERMEQGLCPSCGKPVNDNSDFRDAKSKIEFGISGLCQACQDKVYGE